MALRLVTLFLAQALDLWTFALMVARYGIVAEANPLVANLFSSVGLPALVAGKLALIVAIGALVIAGAAFAEPTRTGHVSVRTWAVVRGVPLALAIAAGLIGAITNTANILR